MSYRRIAETLIEEFQARAGSEPIEAAILFRSHADHRPPSFPTGRMPWAKACSLLLRLAEEDDYSHPLPMAWTATRVLLPVKHEMGGGRAWCIAAPRNPRPVSSQRCSTAKIRKRGPSMRSMMEILERPPRPLKVTMTYTVPAEYAIMVELLAELCRISTDEVAQRAFNYAGGYLAGLVTGKPAATGNALDMVLAMFPELDANILTWLRSLPGMGDVLGEAAPTFDFRKFLK